jgi:hypothetical protein
MLQHGNVPPNAGQERREGCGLRRAALCSTDSLPSANLEGMSPQVGSLAMLPVIKGR